MSTVGIILLVCFIMTMFLWLLAMLGPNPSYVAYSPWLSWFSCLILGVVVFLVGSGKITFSP